MSTFTLTVHFMRHSIVRDLLVLAAAAAIAPLAPAQNATFTTIPLLPGGFQNIFDVGSAVSADGSTVVGTSDSSLGDADAFAYTALTGGVAALGAIESGANYNSQARSVNQNGTFAVGYSRKALSPFAKFRAVTWTYDGNTQVWSLTELGAAGAPAGQNGESYAYDVSDDGAVIVGRSSGPTTASQRAYRYAGGVWTQISSVNFSEALAVSGNGQVVVGDSNDQAFRWTQGGGLTPLGFLNPTGGQASYANDVNTDGSVVVGDSSTDSAGFSPFATEAFRWSGGVMRRLGAIPSAGAIGSSATAVNGNGKVIVGNAIVAETFPPFTTEATVWNPRQGMRSLAAALISAEPSLEGVLSGYRLETARSISRDGRTITGDAVALGGGRVGFVATLPRFCTADFNLDGQVTAQDIFDFLAAWFTASASADVNISGTVTAQDIFDFLAAWFGGC